MVQSCVASSIDKHALSEASCVSRQFASSVTYIGLASLLPKEHQALCACAKLFFARLLHECDNVELEICALPYYFDADPHTRNRHVRTIVLTAAQFAQMVEYDRRLASMATCDIRELVEAHAVQVFQANQQLRLALIEVGTSPQAEGSAQEAEAASVPQGEDVQSPTSHGEKQEKVSYVNGPTVTISHEAIQDAWARMEHQQQHTPSLKQLQVLLLRAALSVAEQPHDQALIRQALVWRDRIPPQLEVTRIFARGRMGQIVGYRMQVGVPQVFAA
jgi:hypothetical protein